MDKHTTTTGRRGFLKQSALAVAAVQVAATACSADAASGAIGETQYGKVRGASENGVHRFLGIRYGAETSGKNRFQPPVKPEPWTGVHDAVEWGKVAPQPHRLTGRGQCLGVERIRPPRGGRGS